MHIEMQHVTVRFVDRKSPSGEVIAVNDMSLRVDDGKLVCLLGPSGCGKSTTLYAIAGLQALSEGRIFFGDLDVTDLDASRREIGLVFQNYALYPHMTVADNIAFPLKNARWSKSQIAERVLEVAHMVQIEPQLDRKPGQLSGGQQQRVAIARAIAKNPKILLMDEPLSNLDAKLRTSTREEIRRIQKATQITTIFVTHDQEEAMTISDEIIIMRDGLLQQIGKPQDVYDNPVNLFVGGFIGSPAMNQFPAVIRGGHLFFENNDLGSVSQKDGDIVLGVRPEAIDPARDGEENTVPARVLHLELLGREILYRIVIGKDTEATMITDIDTQLHEGQEFQASFVLKRRYLFDGTSHDLLSRE